MRIAMIGHPMHSRTWSSFFFVDVLKRYGFHLKYFSSEEFVNPENLAANIFDEIDVFICWQTEDIGEVLVALRKQVILVPMYDAAIQRPSEYWRQFARCKVICFCRALFEQMIDLDLNAYYFQFYPAPMMRGVRRARSSERSLFFWQRRPDSKINIKTLHLLVHDWPQTRIHLHLASDERGGEPESITEELNALGGLGHIVSTSSWFENRGEYISTLRNFRMFLGSRLEEGIGMSFLEPMSMGMCVITNDKPTMNEYIYHRLNGILLNFDDMTDLNCSLEEQEIEEIGRRAVQSITEGRARWMQEIERLCAVVEGVERTRREFCEEHEVAVRRLVFERSNS